MITTIALAILISILASFGFNTQDISYYGDKMTRNEGFCIDLHDGGYQVCLETRNDEVGPGFFFCQPDLSDECLAFDAPSAKVSSLMHALDCTYDQADSFVYCWEKGEVEHLEDGDYIHKGPTQFWMKYPRLQLPALSK